MNDNGGKQQPEWEPDHGSDRVQHCTDQPPGEPKWPNAVGSEGQSGLLYEVSAGPVANLTTGKSTAGDYQGPDSAVTLCSAPSGGGGGAFNCDASLSLAVPPYVAAAGTRTPWTCSPPPPERIEQAQELTESGRFRRGNVMGGRLRPSPHRRLGARSGQGAPYDEQHALCAQRVTTALGVALTLLDGFLALRRPRRRRSQDRWRRFDLVSDVPTALSGTIACLVLRPSVAIGECPVPIRHPFARRSRPDRLGHRRPDELLHRRAQFRRLCLRRVRHQGLGTSRSTHPT